MPMGHAHWEFWAPLWTIFQVYGPRSLAQWPQAHFQASQGLYLRPTSEGKTRKPVCPALSLGAAVCRGSKERLLLQDRWPCVYG